MPFAAAAGICCLQPDELGFAGSLGKKDGYEHSEQGLWLKNVSKSGVKELQNCKQCFSGWRRGAVGMPNWCRQLYAGTASMKGR